MHWSIVIPSYEMAPRLRQSLDNIAAQPVPQGCRLDVVVVDDGSSDDTQRVVEAAARRLPQLRSIHRPRDARSCRSRARNLGLHASQGDYVIFLDAGVLLTSNFLQAACAEVAAHPGAALVFETLGLYAAFAGQGDQAYADLPASDVDALCARLARDEIWKDTRRPYFDAVDHALGRWPAPWLFAWTCALAVPRAEALAIGGFDDEFLNWGAEDVDFAGRLHRAGTPFRAVASTYALHLPHKTIPVSQMQRQHLANAQRMHASLGCRESELYLVHQDAFHVNQLCHRLDALDARMIAPPWPEAAWQACRELLRRSTANLCIGFADLQGLEPGTASVVLAHDHATRRRLARLLPEAEVRCALGVRCPDADAAYELVLIGDVVRLLPDDVVISIFAEARRVGKVVYILLGKRRPRDVRLAAAGWRWLSTDDVVALAAKAGLVATNVAALTGITRIELSVLGNAAAQPGSPFTSPRRLASEEHV